MKTTPSTLSAVMPRKRSRRVALTTMAAVSGSVLLAACGGGAEEEPASSAVAGKTASAADKDAAAVTLIDNVFACQKELGLSEEQCLAKQDEALAAARQSAPRFAALQDCEKDWGEGKCVEDQLEPDGTLADPQIGHEGHHHHAHFSPFVTGYIVGKMLGGKATPVFGAANGGYQTANGWKLGYAGQPGRYYSNARALERPRSVPKVRAASAVAIKSGFGPVNRKGSSGWRLANRTGQLSVARGFGG